MRSIWLVALVLMLPSVNAEFLQMGVSADRSFSTTEEGPKLDEVAWVSQVNGSRALGPPLIIGDHVYMVTSDLNHGDNLTRNAIWRIPLATGEPEALVDLAPKPQPQIGDAAQVPGSPHAMSSDGQNLYVTGATGVESYTLDGTLNWAWPYPELIANGEVPYCAEPAVVSGSIFVACYAISGDAAQQTGQSSGFSSSDLVVFVSSISADGAEQWVWVRDLAEFARTGPASGDTGQAACQTLAEQTCPRSTGRIDSPAGLSVVGDLVIVNVIGIIDRTDGTEYRAFHAIDRLDGVTVWTLEADRQKGLDDGRVRHSYTATGTNNRLYLTMHDLLTLAPRSMEVLSEYDIGREDVTHSEGGVSPSYDGERLYFGSSQTLYAIDALDGLDIFQPITVTDQEDETWGSNTFLVADEIVYGRLTFDYEPPSAQSLYPSGTTSSNAILAFDKFTGESLWRHDFNSPFGTVTYRTYDFGVANGVMIVAGQDGSVTAIGRTAASMSTDVQVSNDFPAFAEEVSVNLAGSEAGRHGAPTQYMADWGDGTITEWQSQPVLTHSFESEGDVTATFGVRNEAGQISREQFVFHVGAEPPTVLDWAAQNQDLTWGVIGIALAAVGGTYGAVKIRQRRSRIRRELLAIDQAFEESKTPTEEARVVQERREHARALLLAGKIDEPQLTIMLNRIDELAKGERLAAIDKRLDFLPHGMVRRLRGMLEDGSVSQWEHEHFLSALDDDKLLTSAQKKKVKTLVDQWFASDVK